MMNYIQYLMQLNIAYILGESSEISIDNNGHKSFQNYFYMCVVGQTFEEKNFYSSSNKELRENIEHIVHQILEFFALRPTNQEQVSSFSGQIKTKVRLIYIHSGVGTWQKGGLRLVAKATSRLPESIQRDIVDQINVVQSKFYLNGRLKFAKLSNLIGIGNSSSLDPHIFNSIKYFNDLQEFSKSFIDRMLVQDK